MTEIRGTLTAAIVIPVYNRLDVLRRTLATLESQDFEPERMHIVIADDGSDDDIQGLIEAWAPRFEKTYIRQEHRGFGAARARNLGASATSVDVLIFLDSDGLVRTDFVSRHVAWHEANTDAVVIGGRVHGEASHLSVELLSSGDALLEETEAGRKDDFRAVLSRRTSRYTSNDEGYRAFVSSNVSIASGLYEEVGGFDNRFRWWGSEDTELGWRLWQAGALFIDDAANRIYHQVDVDTAGGRQGRQDARLKNRGLLASLVPQRFYRRGVPEPPPEVPKISVLVDDVPPGAPEGIWRSLVSQTSPDFELIFIAEPGDHDPWAGAAEGERRCLFIGDGETAIRVARGEYLAFVNGHSALSPTFLQNIRKRLDQRPAAASLAFGVEIPGTGPLVRTSDVRALSEAWNDVLPQGTAVRRRHLARLLRTGATLTDILAGLEDHPRVHTTQALLAMPAMSRTARPEGFSYARGPAKQLWDEAQLGPGQAFKAGLRLAKNRIRPPRPAPAGKTRDAGSDPIGVRYVGWVGKDNLGDEAMLDAVKTLMPWGEVDARGEARDLLLLGGGTLINRNQYLRWLTEHDSPRLERAVFGTGVASPDFWGLTEDTDRWLAWLESCAYVGVRGPRSAEALETWGYTGDLEVCGDPALALAGPEVEVEESKILLAPAWTNGELWGHDDEAVYTNLVEAATTWLDEGREIVFMSCHPTDDRPILEMRDRVGGPTGYIAGYRDTVAALEEIASSALVIGERLHACVLAAATGRPFVPIEYRPKVRDFAESVAMGDYVIRTDEIQSHRIRELAGYLTLPSDDMIEAVSAYRATLVEAAETIRRATTS